MPVIVDDGADERKWLEARRSGISASMIPKAMTPAGRAAFVAEFLCPPEDQAWFDGYREHGKRRESEFLGQWIADNFGMRHNRALFAHSEHPRHLATPDGVGEAGQGLYELKTSTKPMPRTVPRNYRDQMQFQMWVMEEDRVLLVWEQHEDFRPVSLPEWRWVERDDARIAELVAVADALLFEIDTARWQEEHGG